MPTDPPVPTGTDPLVIYTFDYWSVKPNDITGTIPEDNLLNLNAAVKWSADNGIPIYELAGDGLGGIGSIAQRVRCFHWPARAKGVWYGHDVRGER